MSVLSEFLVPWYVKAGLVAVVITGIFSSGVYFESLRWSKAAGKAQIADQRKALDLMRQNVQFMADALGNDAKQSIADAKSMDELERISNEIVSKTPDTVCLAPDGTDRLRRIFDGKAE